MKEVALTDAKAHFSRLVDDAKNGEPSVITRHGRKEVVVVSFEEWRKATAKPSLWEMLTNAPIDGRDLPRDPSPMRKVDF